MVYSNSIINYSFELIKRIRLPSRFVRVDRVSGTVAVMNKKSGKLKGRKKVKGKGDTTRVRRVVKDVDVDKDGKVDYRGGTILGRTKVRVRASKRAKGFIRRI